MYVKRRIAYDCTNFYFPEDPPNPVNPEPNPQPAPAGSKRDVLSNKKRKRMELGEGTDGQDGIVGDEEVCVPRRGPGGGDGRPPNPSTCTKEFLNGLGELSSKSSDECE